LGKGDSFAATDPFRLFAEKIYPLLADHAEPTNHHAVEKGGLFSGIKNVCPAGLGW